MIVDRPKTRRSEIILHDQSCKHPLVIYSLPKYTPPAHRGNIEAITLPAFRTHQVLSSPDSSDTQHPIV